LELRGIRLAAEIASVCASAMARVCPREGREVLMSIDQETVKHIAHLARIELQPNELEKLSGQLHDILDFVDKINNLDLDKIEPATHILPISNVLREDTPHISLSPEKALENSPSRKGNFFSVPKVIE